MALARLFAMSETPLSQFLILCLSQAVAQSAKDALKWLVERKMLLWDKKASAYEPIKLGKACLASGMDPEQALMVHQVPFFLPLLPALSQPKVPFLPCITSSIKAGALYLRSDFEVQLVLQGA